jgi:hypothetical protein
MFTENTVCQSAIVTSDNGSPTLMVRIANGRMTLLTDAAVRLGVVLLEESQEGRYLRQLHDLHSVERDSLSVGTKSIKIARSLRRAV